MTSRTFNGRSRWTPERDAALIEHYSIGTVTNTAFAERIGTTEKAILARAHELKLTRHVKPSTRSVIPHFMSGISHPEPWITRHSLGA